MGERLNAAVIVFLTLLACSFLTPGSERTLGENPAVAVEQKILTTPRTVPLGLAEGLTEYLPVSSTGHLLLAGKIMGIGKDPYQSSAQREQTKEAVDAYTFCIQAGAILAVLWLYYGRIKQILWGMIGKYSAGRRLLFNIEAGFLPAAVLGLLFNRVIKSHLSGPWPLVAVWPLAVSPYWP